MEELDIDIYEASLIVLNNFYVSLYISYVYESGDFFTSFFEIIHALFVRYHSRFDCDESFTNFFFYDYFAYT